MRSFRRETLGKPGLWPHALGKAFASADFLMSPDVESDLYSPREIARAADVSEEQAIALAGGADKLVPYAEALGLARALKAGLRTTAVPFSVLGPALPRRRDGAMLAWSGAAHLITIAGVLIVTGLGHASSHTIAPHAPATDLMRLVYFADPGPGGGGGGGGRRNPLPPPRSLREGTHALSSPLPPRQEPPAATQRTPPPVAPPDLPPTAVPAVASPADARDRSGVLENVSSEADSQGPGAGGGGGKGTGTGLGDGKGPGVGPGSGGGTGGGPFRPGSGIAPPRLLQEIKPTYPESARRNGITGEVDMEIVVRRDGAVGEIRIIKGLSPELNDRAVDAVQQWRFAPATRLGVPVDVIVEVSVEFKLR